MFQTEYHPILIILITCGLGAYDRVSVNEKAYELFFGRKRAYEFFGFQKKGPICTLLSTYWKIQQFDTIKFYLKIKIVKTHTCALLSND